MKCRETEKKYLLHTRSFIYQLLYPGLNTFCVQPPGQRGMPPCCALILIHSRKHSCHGEILVGLAPQCWPLLTQPCKRNGRNIPTSERSVSYIDSRKEWARLFTYWTSITVQQHHCPLIMQTICVGWWTQYILAMDTVYHHNSYWPMDVDSHMMGNYMRSVAHCVKDESRYVRPDHWVSDVMGASMRSSQMPQQNSSATSSASAMCAVLKLRDDLLATEDQRIIKVHHQKLGLSQQNFEFTVAKKYSKWRDRSYKLEAICQWEIDGSRCGEVKGGTGPRETADHS